MNTSRQVFIVLTALLALLVSRLPAYACTIGTNCYATGAEAPARTPVFGEPNSGLATGLFEYAKNDLTVGGLMPIEITRVYRSEDYSEDTPQLIKRDFGYGTSFNYALYLYSHAEVNNQANPYASINVMMPDDAALNCACSNNDCGSYETAVLACGTTQPAGIWANSTLAYDAAIPGWTLTRKDATVYTFGQGAPLQQITDRYGNYIKITRSGGQVTQVSSSSGRYVNFTYTGGYVTQIEDNSGRIVSYTYSSNALTLVTYPNDPNATIQYKYDGGCSGSGAETGDICDVILNVSNSLSGKNNNYVTYGSLGTIGLVVAAFEPNSGNGEGYQYAYTLNPTNSWVSLNQVTLPDGTGENFAFDQYGYVSKNVRVPATKDETTVFTRDGNHNVTEVQEEDTNNNVLRTFNYQYNGFDDITSIEVTPGPGTNSSATTTFNYQTAALASGADLDELTSVVDPLNNSTSYYYDDLGNLTSVEAPALSIGTPTWTFTYYANGEVKTARDPNLNPATQYAYYSPSGDLETVTDPLGHTTTYGTDQLGRTTSVTSPMGALSQYSYDPIDDLAAETDPNGNETQYTYDLLGEIASVTDPRNNTTTYTRPATLNKLTVCDPLTECTVTNYDAGAKATDQTDRRGVKTVLTYDGLRRLTQAVYNSSGVSGIPKRTIKFTNYDALDRVGTITDSLGGNASSPGNTLTYTYDGVDDVMSEASTYSGYSAGVTYNYDAAGRRTNMTATPSSGQGNPTAYSYGYDADDELTGISGGAVPVTLGYDLDGNRKTLTESASGGAVATSYGYDAGNRLTSQSYTAGANSLGGLNYTYDNDDRLTLESGSLASLNLPPALSSATYTATNQISNWGGTNSSADAASNLLADPSNSAAIKWDERNLLQSVSGGPATSFTPQYDSKTRRENDTGAYSGTNYYLDDQKNVANSANVNGSTVTPYAYEEIPGSGEVVAYSPSSGTTLIPIDDGSGSTIGLVGSSNTLQTQWSYEPFGAPTQSGTASPFPFLFGGAQYDPTGYYSDYSPRLARSLSGGDTPYDGVGATGTHGAAAASGGGGSNGAVAAGTYAAEAVAVAVLAYEFPPLAITDIGIGINLAAPVAALVSALEDIFGFGGSSAPTYPPSHYKKAHNPEGPIIGVQGGLTPDQSVPAPQEIVGSFGVIAGMSVATADDDILFGLTADEAFDGAVEIALGLSDPIVLTALAVDLGYEAYIHLSKGGKKRGKDTGLANLNDEQIKTLAGDKSLPMKERQKYVTEQKYRAKRNIQKRKQYRKSQ